VAQPGDAGSLVRASSTGSTKTVAQVLAYSGTSTTAPIVSVASAAELSKSAGHRTPTTTSSAGSWAVSLWSNKSSLTTGWTAPAGVTVRQYQGTTTYGGLTAIASQSGTMATMWTIVLNPR